LAEEIRNANEVLADRIVGALKSEEPPALVER
jgi:hypothetical protein